MAFRIETGFTQPAADIITADFLRSLGSFREVNKGRGRWNSLSGHVNRLRYQEPVTLRNPVRVGLDTPRDHSRSRHGNHRG